MMPLRAPIGWRRRWTSEVARLSTSTKMIAILSLALMPLGIIALLASLESSQNADAVRHSELRIAATESTRKLAAELTSDVVALRDALRVIDANPGTGEVCANADAIVHARLSRRVTVALFGKNATPVCAVGDFTVERPRQMSGSTMPAFRRVGDGLDLVVPSASGSSVAVARYSSSTLASFALPVGYGMPTRLALNVNGATLLLADRLKASSLGPTDAETLPLGIGDLAVTTTIAATPFGATEALLAFLPLLMWASAAVVSFSVVESLLIRPLRSLRSAVANYVPGSLRPLTLSSTPSIEIRALGESFVMFADRLSQREHDLEQALANQVKLTREVHHRVKNNLQVIASLISLHARGSSSEAQTAYVGIQRRVDALAVVHRNHFAELESGDGIELKQLLGELAANFRASIATKRGAPAVTVTSDAITVAQDTAMPLAFLFTEIAEMATNGDPAAPITAIAERKGASSTGRLTITSIALQRVTPQDNSTPMRIIEGLARQLRAPLAHGEGGDSYAIDFKILDRDQS